MENIAENSNPNPDLRGAAEQMLEVLERRAEAASLSMALADEASSKLEEEIDNHEGLGRQAEEFLREGDEEAARRCVALRLQSAEQVKRLTERYQRLQGEAEANVSLFRTQRKEVEDRVAEIPELEQDQRLLRAQEKIEELSKLSLSNPQTAFDQAAQAIRVRQKQLAGKNLLVSDPNAELDRRIREATDRRQLDQAMVELRKKVGASEKTVDAEFTVVDDDAVNAARKLLEAPRYQGLVLPAVSNRETLRVVARKRG